MCLKLRDWQLKINKHIAINKPHCNHEPKIYNRYTHKKEKKFKCNTKTVIKSQMKGFVNGFRFFIPFIFEEEERTKVLSSSRYFQWHLFLIHENLLDSLKVAVTVKVIRLEIAGLGPLVP